MFYAAALIVMFCQMAQARDTPLDTARIIIRPSNTSININGQNLAVHYIIYDDNIVVKISDNLVHVFNSMMTKLKNDNNMLIYNTAIDHDVVVDLQQLQSIFIVPENVGKFIELPTVDVMLIEKTFPKKYLLQLNLDPEKESYLITKFAYKEMKKTLISARNQNQLIKINLDFFPLNSDFCDKKAIDTNFKSVPDRRSILN
jgi:hypothetical protein